ncbi:MAG: YoaK family protein [Acidimicrobiales bacterium]
MPAEGDEGDETSRRPEREGAAGHASAPGTASQRSSERLAWVLAAKAGFVDAVGYIALYHLFTAHQSGNSDALGVALGGGTWHAAWPRATSLVAFVVGIAVGTLLVEQCRRHRPRWAGGSLAVAELLVLGGTLAIGMIAGSAGHLAQADVPAYEGAAATLAGAMGIQTVTLRQVGRLRVRTTFVTGLLTNMSESFVVALHHPRGSQRQQFLRYSGFTASVWLLYVLGAIAGAGAERAWSFEALGVPLAIVVLVGTWEFRHGFVPTLPTRGLPKPAE